MSRATKDETALQEIWASVTKEGTRLLALVKRGWDGAEMGPLRLGTQWRASDSFSQKKEKQVKAGSNPRLTTGRSWRCHAARLSSSKLVFQMKRQQVSPGSDGWTGRCAKEGGTHAKSASCEKVSTKSGSAWTVQRLGLRPLKLTAARASQEIRMF